MTLEGTAGPARILLDAFCLLAEGEAEAPASGREAAPGWLAGEARKVDCERHPGRFDIESLRRWKIHPPSVRVASLGVASAKADGDGSVLLELRLAAAVISNDSPTEFHGDRARRLAERICFDLARRQELADSRGRRCNAWALLAFGEGALDRGHPGGARGLGIGCPREIRAANLYSSAGDKRKVAIWAVTWLQGFRARPADFGLPAIEEGAIPETVKSGFAPDIGTGHEGDYGQVAPEEGA